MTLDDDLTGGLEKIRKEHERRTVAYHEAGHALVGLLLGHELLAVGMDGQTHFEGERCTALVNGEGVLTPDDREFLLGRAKIAFAGTAGEAIGLGGAHPLGPNKDHKMAYQFLTRVGSRKERPQAQDLNNEVLLLVLSNQSALHRIAAALLAEDTLSPERVRELMAEPDK